MIGGAVVVHHARCSPCPPPTRWPACASAAAQTLSTAMFLSYLIPSDAAVPARSPRSCAGSASPTPSGRSSSSTRRSRCPFCTWLLMGFVRTVPARDRGERPDRRLHPLPGLPADHHPRHRARHHHGRDLRLHPDVPGVHLRADVRLRVRQQDDLVRGHHATSSAGDVFYWGSLMSGALIGAVPVADRLRVQPRPLHPRPHRRRAQVSRSLDDPKEEKSMTQAYATAVPRHHRGRRPRRSPTSGSGPRGRSRSSSRSCAGATSCPPTTSGSTQFGQQWAPRTTSRSRSTTSRICRSRPRSRPRSPPSRATTSCSWSGSGTEKCAPALLDVQDLADKLGKKHGGWTPLAENYCKVADGKFHSIPDFFIDFPGLYRKDLWTEMRACRTAPTPGTTCARAARKLKAKGFPIGIGLAHHDDSRDSWRAIMWSLRRLRGGQGRQDPHLQLQGDPRGAQVQRRRSTRRR